MEEITREQFWFLESLLAEIEKSTGKMEVLRNGEDRLYKRGFKKWMRSMTLSTGATVYLADSSLIVEYLK